MLHPTFNAIPFHFLNRKWKKQPNLVVYMIDDLGWNQISAKQATMGTHTGSFITPNIEKLPTTVSALLTPTLNQIVPHHGPQCSQVSTPHESIMGSMWLTVSIETRNLA
ncbi:MAG: hypothetical protein CM15mP130_0200 [Verrucomicrobiota bacterium]|nr:MAG: hypothetical protein CM15mP130_0200 [Verrucomicrobiota bacterium]